MRLHAEIHVNEPKKGNRMDKVNWPVFQAAAAVVGGAAAQSNRRLSIVIEEEFITAYYGLLAIADQIHQQEEQEVQAEQEQAQSDTRLRPLVDFGE